MDTKISFETPENIQVTYKAAGLGSRFIAWFIDTMLFGILCFVLFIFLMFLGVAVDGFADVLKDLLPEGGPNPGNEAPLYIFGFAMVIISLGGFIYFGLSELFLRGRTIGKKYMSLRVVKCNGFSLNAGSILVRNIFRLIDHLPILWIVPVVSERSQRLGDMVGDTIVITEKKETISGLREELLKLAPAAARFRFDARALGSLRQEDIRAAEHLLERWNNLTPQQQEKFISPICGAISQRIGKDEPPPEHRLQFLEELLAAEYRRQLKRLG